jgi:hypothetical protein
MRKIARIALYGCLWLLITGCVTAVDDKLPYSQLPEIIVATQFSPVASPSHPTAYLTSATIAAGEKVSVIGMDNDAAWLLILHNEQIGWMPTFYSRTNVGNLKPALQMTPLSAQCTKYLGATFAAGESWVSGVDGDLLVIGSVYRPQAGPQFQDTTLAITIAGQGNPLAADYLHPSLTATSALGLFAFALTGLQKDSRISFDLANPGAEPLSFQAAFFSTTCPDLLRGWTNEFVDRLPIGVTKLDLPKPRPTPTRPAPTVVALTPTTQPLFPTLTPTPVIIKRPSGPTGSPQSAALPADIEQVLLEWDRIHHESDRTLDPVALPTVLTGAALTQQQQTLQKLQQGNCYWEFTDLAPSVTLAWQQLSVSEVLVDAQKHWDARLYCNGKFSERDSFNEPFLIRYRLLLTDGWRIAEKKTINADEVLSTAATGTSPSQNAPSQPSQADNPLRANLLAKSQNSAVALVHRTQATALIDALLGHLDEFQLPNLGITRRTMTDALNRADAGDRLNAVVQEVWADWQNNARTRNFDAATADPGSRGFSPFRQLIIRLIQGRQGRLSDSQQHALHNYFTRNEEASVWQRDPDAVIGAINRESFQWP